MTRYEAIVATDHASRYLQQLCKHWGHKFKVEFDPAHGRIEFDGETACILDAGAGTLRLLLEGKDAERVARMRGVVAEHIARFAFREELDISWHDAEIG